MSVENPKYEAYLNVIKWVEAEYAYDPGEPIVFGAAAGSVIALAAAIGLTDEEIDAAILIGKYRGNQRLEQYVDQAKQEYHDFLVEEKRKV